MDSDLSDKSKWSNSLDPNSIVGLDGSAGYLERVMTGTDRRFLKATASRPDKKKVHQSKPAVASKKPFQTRLPIADIDPVSWITDRRKNFPKLSGGSPKKVETEKASPKKRKTLFEKLMDMDQQSNI